MKRLTVRIINLFYQLKDFWSVPRRGAYSSPTHHLEVVQRLQSIVLIRFIVRRNLQRLFHEHTVRLSQNRVDDARVELLWFKARLRAVRPSWLAWLLLRRRFARARVFDRPSEKSIHDGWFS